MNRILTLIKETILWLWQAPQNLLGLVLWAIYSKDSYSQMHKGIRVVVNPRFPGGISLGNTILLWCDLNHHEDTWNHEWGHTRQSRMLGPLYLLVIGLPSIIWAATYKYDIEYPNKYYSFYTERWADKLGGVKRTP